MFRGKKNLFVKSRTVILCTESRCFCVEKVIVWKKYFQVSHVHLSHFILNAYRFQCVKARLAYAMPQTRKVEIRGVESCNCVEHSLKIQQIRIESLECVSFIHINTENKKKASKKWVNQRRIKA